jgi:hypothetical protein
MLKQSIMDAITGIVSDAYIICVQTVGSSVRVTFSSVAHRDKFMYAGLDGAMFPVKEAGVRGTYVQVYRLPYEVADEDLKTFFGRFGRVFGASRVYDNQCHGFDTGSRVVPIVRQRDIPRDLRLWGFDFTAFYRGQPAQCTICKEWSHRARECSYWGKCRQCGEKGHLKRNYPHLHILSASGKSDPDVTVQGDTDLPDGASSPKRAQKRKHPGPQSTRVGGGDAFQPCVLYFSCLVG